MAFVAIKIGGRQGGPSRTGTWRKRICSDTRSHGCGTAGLFSLRPLRAAVGWLFFRVVRFSCINSDTLVALALKIRLGGTGGESDAISGTGH
jgi:hypothetical protein